MTILEGRLLEDPAIDDGTVAVTSHILLNALSIMVGSAATLRHRLDSFEPDEVMLMLTRIERQGRAAACFVQDMARGLPPDVSALLDELP